MPRTTEEKIMLAKKFIDSKMSKRAFCKKYKISCSTLNNYLVAFDKPIDGMNPPLKYIELPPEVETMPNPIQNTCNTMSGVDGLCSIIMNQFDLDPKEHIIFAFCNRARNRIKLEAWYIEQLKCPFLTFLMKWKN